MNAPSQIDWDEIVGRYAAALDVQEHIDEFEERIAGLHSAAAACRDLVRRVEKSRRERAERRTGWMRPRTLEIEELSRKARIAELERLGDAASLGEIESIRAQAELDRQYLASLVENRWPDDGQSGLQAFVPRTFADALGPVGDYAGPRPDFSRVAIPSMLRRRLAAIAAALEKTAGIEPVDRWVAELRRRARDRGLYPLKGVRVTKTNYEPVVGPDTEQLVAFGVFLGDEASGIQLQIDDLKEDAAALGTGQKRVDLALFRLLQWAEHCNVGDRELAVRLVERAQDKKARLARQNGLSLDGQRVDDVPQEEKRLEAARSRWRHWSSPKWKAGNTTKKAIFEAGERVRQARARGRARLAAEEAGQHPAAARPRRQDGRRDRRTRNSRSRPR